MSSAGYECSHNGGRRAVLAAIAGACLPGTLLAQAPKAPRVALVDPAEQTDNMAEGRNPFWGALLAELRQLGYVEGKTIAIERWSGGGDTGSYGELARKIVATRPRIVVTRGRTITSTVAAASSEIAIVAVGSISSDLRATLARPGGNVTGVHGSADDQQIYSKQLEFMRELTKANARIAWLGPQLLWDGPVGAAARAGAKQAALELRPVFVSSPVTVAAIEAAFAAARNGKFDGVLVAPAVEFFPHRLAVGKLALETRLPSVANGVNYVEAGALLSYSSLLVDNYRRAAHYVDRILRGAKPGDLPIEQPSRMQLVVNLTTAKALGITVPKSLLLRADRLIE